jgi:hypothetical protein
MSRFHHNPIKKLEPMFFQESYKEHKNKIFLELRGDTLLHIFPVDDQGKPNQNLHWTEKYVRMEQ